MRKACRDRRSEKWESQEDKATLLEELRQCRAESKLLNQELQRLQKERVQFLESLVKQTVRKELTEIPSLGFLVIATALATFSYVTSTILYLLSIQVLIGFVFVY